MFLMFTGVQNKTEKLFQRVMETEQQIELVQSVQQPIGSLKEVQVQDPTHLVIEKLPVKEVEDCKSFWLVS